MTRNFGNTSSFTGKVLSTVLPVCVLACPVPHEFLQSSEKPIVAVLREKSFLIILFPLDDILLIGKSFKDCQDALWETFSMLVKLGFVINLKKSTLLPIQILEFLGFILNTLRMKITLPASKVEKFKSLGNKLLAKPSCTIREVACLIGLMTSYSTAMRFGRLFTHLEIQKITALHEAADNFDQLMTLDATSRKDILWWISQLDSEYSLIKIPAPSVTMY